MARAPAALRLVADRAARALAAVDAPADGDGLAAAVSGGADSLALLHGLRTLAGPRSWRLAVVTVDHGLRPGSAADAAFVVDHAKTLGLPATLVTLEPAELAEHRRAGPEGAARTARYRALWRAAGELGCGWLATGHTLDDQAETVLLQLLRGAGAEGLAGMAVRSDRLLRPLLGVRRAETRACCAALGIGWREDPTNQQSGPLRNRVRHQVLPLLEELRPGAALALARAAGLAAEERAWLEPLVADALAGALAGAAPAAATEERQDGALAGAVRLDAATLAGLPVGLGRRVVRAAARRAGASPPDADATDRVLALAGPGRPGRSAAWPGGLARRAGTSVAVAGGPRDH
jgi:tRNA(Ile)-lysidine synthase